MYKPEYSDILHETTQASYIGRIPYHACGNEDEALSYIANVGL